MKKLYVKVNGITCDHCRNTIKNGISELKNIKKVNVDKNIVEIDYDNQINRKELVNKINKLGYHTGMNMIFNKKPGLNKLILEIFIILMIFIFMGFILNKTLGFNIFNVIPAVNTNVTFGMLFIIGMLTSIHCISMCGAINLIASSSENRNVLKPILYNLGRLISYTLLGGLVGGLGSIFKINVYLHSIIIMISAIFMFFFALNMLGLIKFKFSYRLPSISKNVKTKSSFVIGLLNGFMPCGPLQTMQIYALSTGSFIYGAFSMFIFCLGTIPLMLLFGMVSNLLKVKYRNILNKVFTTLIILLSIIMFNRGLLGMGIDISNIFVKEYSNYIKAEIKDNYQYIRIDLNYNGYEDIIVQKDIPVKMIIMAKEETITGCNNFIKINDFNIEKELVIGENIIEFTPKETGSFTYTCWMGMLKNNILVVDDIDKVKVK